MAVSELPGNPNAVWTVRRHVEGMQYFPKDREVIMFLWGFCLLLFCFSVQGDRNGAAWCHPQKLWLESAATCLSLEATHPLVPSCCHTSFWQRGSCLQLHPSPSMLCQLYICSLKLLNLSCIPTSHKVLPLSSCSNISRQQLLLLLERTHYSSCVCWQLQ